MIVDLIQIVTAAMADATARSGEWLKCGAGCSQCCVGVFPIGWQDADRIHEGLIALEQVDPERAARVRARTALALERLDPWFPGDIATGVLGESYEEAILFEEFANNEPCPALDLNHGTCDLYESRPILCRTFGPPMRTEERATWLRASFATSGQARRRLSDASLIRPFLGSKKRAMRPMRRQRGSGARR